MAYKIPLSPLLCFSCTVISVVLFFFSILLPLQWPHRTVGPQQIHLAFGNDSTTIVVQWSTAENCTPIVYFGVKSNTYTHQVVGETWLFTYGNEYGLQWMNRVILRDLAFGQQYYYVAESDARRSKEYHFTTPPEGTNWAPKFIVYGDMGKIGGAPILNMLIEEVASQEYTAIIHAGDFAYDFEDEGGKRGDGFMESVEPLAAYVPYMTCVGNHEAEFLFGHYRNRFTMPGTQNMWFSWNAGPVHFIAYSTEAYFHPDGGSADEQLKWLEQDLIAATDPETRKIRPWIIAYGHRPMYCSNTDTDCTELAPILRASLEPLFWRYRVDVIIEAHEHSYERLWPVVNETVTAYHYINPEAPVHFVSGAAGCNEQTGLCVNPIPGPRGPWSAFRSWAPGLYGFGILQALNHTYLSWKQVMAFSGQVEDSIVIVQTHTNHAETLNPSN